MDAVSLRIANALVRNSPSSLALEITLTGPILEALVDVTVAVAGADMSVSVDGELLPSYRSARVRAGGLIVFGRRRSGARAYLAVDGGLRAKDGRIGKDELLSGHARTELAAWRPADPLIHLAPSEIPTFETPVELRVLEGPQRERLSMAGWSMFAEEEFTVGLDSNRAGVRLFGKPVEFAVDARADIVSEAAPRGTIQLPASGNPIILTADGPTTGGYAKIATIITADLARVGQLAPGDTVRFRRVTLAEAREGLARQMVDLRAIEFAAGWPRLP